MKLRETRVAILAENDYEDMELQYPLYRMKEEGAEVTVVGTGSASEYKGKHGLPVKADTTADKVKASDFDGVIIPGGWAPDRMRRYPAMVDFVREMDSQRKLVATICHGGWMLCSAKNVKGRTLTAVSAIKDDLENAGANFVDREVVRDGNLVTSRVPADLPAFCRTIVEVLEEQKSGAKQPAAAAGRG
jgi:protease I